MTGEDIIEIKPAIGPFALNVRALWRRLRQRPIPDPVLIVAHRFLQVFEEHDVAISQIPRLIPELSLAQLRNPDNLLHVLTPDILKRTATLFQIRESWLEGTSEIIYDCHPSYKNPWAFFEDVNTLDVEQHAFPVVAFCAEKELESTSDRNQPVVLVLREKCAQIDDKTIYRYRIHDEFYWGYWKSRIQLKAMMRVWYKKFGTPVPIYRINEYLLEQLEAGVVIPRAYYRNSILFRGQDLEDYSLSPTESRRAKDPEELATVLNYIDAFKLEQVGEKGVENPLRTAEALRFTQ